MSFEWKSNNLHLNLAEFSPKVDRQIAIIFDFQATRGEMYEKTNARWTDRTGAARATLSGSARHFPMKSHELIFSHGMHYGIWLEVANDERFAIILETMRVIGRDTMNQIDGLFGRMR